MVIEVAVGQEMVIQSTGTVTYTTPAIPLRGYDMVSCMFVVHGIYGGVVVGDRHVAYHVQSSTDGVRWVDQGTTIEVDEASDTPRLDTHDVYGTYVRFQFGMAVDASPPGSVLFTLKVRLMRQSS